MEAIKLNPCAKINFILKIVEKSKDGYHNLKTLIQPISLFDELYIERTTKGLDFSCIVENNLPGEELLNKKSDNISIKATKLFFSEIKEEPRVKISLIKHIPVGGGLGGGCSDAASVLSGLNKVWGCPLGEKKLYELGEKLGMDVNFFLGTPKLALCGGRGEIIEKRWENKLLDLWFVLINPRKALRTAEVYKEVSLSLTDSNTRDSILCFPDNPTYNNIIRYIRNDLEKAAIKLCPEIGDILLLLKDTDVNGSFVCGSGSTVCGLVSNKNKAEEVKEKLKGNGKSSNWWIRIVPIL